MQLSKFIEMLAPTFTRDDLETEFEELSKVINNINYPFLNGVIKELGKYDFSTTFTENLEDSFQNDLKMKRSFNFLGYFLEITKEQRDQLPMIQKLMDEHFEDVDFSSHNLTLQKVNTLQYIPIMMFVSRFIRTFSNYALGLEINAKSEGEPVYELIPAERDWLDSNRTAFLDSVRVIMRRSTNIEKTFEGLPDLAVSPSNAKVIEHTQAGKADPLALGIIPLAINPFFWIGKKVVDYQTTRYHLAVDEYKMLERKAYNLKLIARDRNDAGLQKQIKYLEENRINPLKQKIAQWEEEYVNNA